MDVIFWYTFYKFKLTILRIQRIDKWFSLTSYLLYFIMFIPINRKRNGAMKASQGKENRYKETA
jgi:hypothetical protein